MYKYQNVKMKILCLMGGYVSYYFQEITGPIQEIIWISSMKIKHLNSWQMNQMRFNVLINKLLLWYLWIKPGWQFPLVSSLCDKLS